MGDVILVGDVGGTNVRFALARKQAEGIEVGEFIKRSGDDFATFDDVLAEYFSEVDTKVTEACFAMAGPVKDGEVNLTNRDWDISAERLKSRFNLKNVCLINDFTAMARAVPELAEDKLEVILPGSRDPERPIIVAGPGTGFGVATLLPSGRAQWKVLAGEGGHIAYSPRDKLEFEVASALVRTHGYVSNELVSSGMGLDAVHRAFCEVFDRPFEPMRPEKMRQMADEGDEMFDRLIALRANAVMGAVGDLVLANGALGGVVLAGGVTERIVDYLVRPEAIRRFRERGPMSGYLADCSVRLMHDPEAPLIGAAAYYIQETHS